MSYISLILLKVVLPILILLAIGAMMQKKFRFQLRPIANLITYCFMPAAVFLNIYQAEFDYHLLSKLVVYLILFSTSLILLGILLSKLLKLKWQESTALKNSISLMNSGNYGLPVSQFIFSTNPLGVSIQIIVLVFQNLLTYTYGLYNLISATKSAMDILKSLLRLPIVHALLLGIVFQVLNLQLPDFAMIPIERLADGFAPLALILLGAQLVTIRFRSFHRAIGWSLAGRLIAGPAFAMLFIFLLGIEGVMAQSLLIASAFPTSRNTATLSLEYDVAPELHAQIVLYSTLLSSITVTIVIYVAMHVL
ncbi:AEC family transporter [Virgibacillus sp. 179-BFC.A HS]|uniref:AEC family transporter n=1 Tax=Tigheibacillus jepli TaxID=3035914 RepID=A0ABU5CNS2_9BACI|nr:AEC family transporter [Virgibacillus sp. 179-BFC.A HS]MDY0407108.1 AEC family transporter [Virgibacillus sp. 179-BFC.A HS]